MSGTTDETWGETNVYWLAGTAALVPAAVPEVVTVTGRVVADPTSGVTTVTEVGVWATTGTPIGPKWTWGDPVPNPTPSTTTERPPVAGPELALSPVTDGQPALDPENRVSNPAARGLPHPEARS